MVTPVTFLEMYHLLFIADPLLGVLSYASLRRYISGEPADGMVERGRLLDRIATARKDGSRGQIPNLFTLPSGHGIPTSEEFNLRAIRRAYAGRGSPNEMIDAVRLAVAFGLVTHPVSAGDYVEKWFGSDCNAFVGNWLGISPSCSIRAYFTGYGTGAIPGSNAGIEASRRWLPLLPVASAGEVRMGNVVVTYGPPNDTGKQFKHIALVESCTSMGGGRHRLELAEWGQAGDIDKHHRTLTVRFDTSWRNPERPKVPVLSFEDMGKHGLDHRVVLDHAPLNVFPWRGWEIAGQWGV
ncbi:MAG: hypothetical protein MUE41_10740 [Gemmatimonadaceae bacterium]|nr:hypothetical protein [Gemmatimonadaceae bacterium]